MFYSQLLCCKSIIVWYLPEQRQSQTAFALEPHSTSVHVEKHGMSSSSHQILGGRLELYYSGQLPCLTKPFFLLQKRPASGNKWAGKPGQCMLASNRKQALLQNSPVSGFEFRHLQTCPAQSSVATHSSIYPHCSWTPLSNILDSICTRRLLFTCCQLRTCFVNTILLYK